MKSLLVELPASLKNFFEEQGFTQSAYFESRNQGRLRCRCEGTLHVESSPPCFQRLDGEMQVLVKDISKCSIAFLTHEQLWPEERIRIEFLGKRATSTLLRCRRLGDRCYECAAKLHSFASLD